jgi:hypothetical protein
LFPSKQGEKAASEAVAHGMWCASIDLEAASAVSAVAAEEEDVGGMSRWSKVYIRLKEK